MWIKKSENKKHGLSGLKATVYSVMGGSQDLNF